jgi:hypothetical protein
MKLLGQDKNSIIYFDANAVVKWDRKAIVNPTDVI